MRHSTIHTGYHGRQTPMSRMYNRPSTAARLPRRWIVHRQVRPVLDSTRAESSIMMMIYCEQFAHLHTSLCFKLRYSLSYVRLCSQHKVRSNVRCEARETDKRGNRNLLLAAVTTRIRSRLVCLESAEALPIRTRPNSEIRLCESKDSGAWTLI